MKFNSGKEMLDYILDGHDLYSSSTATYVFAYNDLGSIAVYGEIFEDEANELHWKANDSDEYWGAFLGIGGMIYDSVEYIEEQKGDVELAIEMHQLNIQWCSSSIDIDDWIDTSDYDLTFFTDEEAKEFAEEHLGKHDCICCYSENRKTILTATTLGFEDEITCQLETMFKDFLKTNFQNSSWCTHLYDDCDITDFVAPIRDTVIDQIDKYVVHVVTAGMNF